MEKQGEVMERTQRTWFYNLTLELFFFFFPFFFTVPPVAPPGTPSTDSVFKLTLLRTTQTVTGLHHAKFQGYRDVFVFKESVIL